MRGDCLAFVVRTVVLAPQVLVHRCADVRGCLQQLSRPRRRVPQGRVRRCHLPEEVHHVDIRIAV